MLLSATLLFLLNGEQFCKPGSVSDGYLSGTCVTAGLKPLVGKPSRPFVPSGCSGWGLHGTSVAIVPVRSYRTFPQSGMLAESQYAHPFSVALSLESLPPAVSRHPCSMEPGLSSDEKFVRNRLNYSITILAHLLPCVNTELLLF